MRRSVVTAVLGALLTLAVAAPATAIAGQGDVIHVDDDALIGGNGSSRFPYQNIADALAEARTTSETVVIDVASGNYPVSSPLVIDRPLDLRGTSSLAEGDDGWPTGEVAPGTETRLFGTSTLGTQPLIAPGRPDRTVVHGISIRGFVFEGTPGGISVLLRRVQNFSLKDNVFRAPAFLGMQSVASSGVISGNHFGGVGTGAVLTGGYPASPSSVRFTGNRSVANNLGGLLLNGASLGIPELGDRLDAVVLDNDLSDNSLTPRFSFGLRLFILRRDPGAPGDSQSAGNVRAVVKDNRIAGNELGMSMDAGFPYRQVGATCDPRDFTGTIDLQLKDNVLTGSLLAPALVTFTRNDAALDLGALRRWQYLHDATFAISDPQAGRRVDRPPSGTPFLGPCQGDATNEALGNALPVQRRRPAGRPELLVLHRHQKRSQRGLGRSSRSDRLDRLGGRAALDRLVSEGRP